MRQTNIFDFLIESFTDNILPQEKQTTFCKI